MREKELRLALVCYGGVSLAVYMHGITKEIWRLAQASQAFHADDPATDCASRVYRELLGAIRAEADLDLHILVDILAGASAGGINAIFLADAITSGRSLEPLTDLWLESADVDALIDAPAGGFKSFAKGAAVPFAWALTTRSAKIDQTVEPQHQAEVRAKLSNFVRTRWFTPPFGGTILTGMLLDAFQAMAAAPAGPPLLPVHQPLDLFVTVTDFRGHPEQLRLNSPPLVTETEHRVTLSFRCPAGSETRQLASPADLAFAARATASFPGAFPPFQARELDGVLAERGQNWPDREASLARLLPHHAQAGDAADAVLIDGSVLTNAPFAPAIEALQDRPARREVDRRFVYIDPKPGIDSVRLTSSGPSEPPGFFTTIFGALSDIPREQPIRDNLEEIDRRSSRVRRLRRILDSMRPEVESAIERGVGSSFFFGRPTPKRLAIWRGRLNLQAAREAGYAYAPYGQLKVATVAEEIAETLSDLAGQTARAPREEMRKAVWRQIKAQGLNAPDAVTARGARADVILFFRNFDIGFRTRRLRFVARSLTAPGAGLECAREQANAVRGMLYEMIAHYRAAADLCGAGAEAQRLVGDALQDPAAAMQALADCMNLKGVDEETDRRFTEMLDGLPKQDRRALILNYLGYPFYDIATLPLLQGEGLDEFDPVKVDRISPDDAVAIRSGGASATLKGIQFNSFGAFFSRAYRENDYLWGRLHGADRLIDIVVSTMNGARLSDVTVSRLKRDAFRAILAEERPRLSAVTDLIAELEREIG